jgi:hypothetical protein
MTLPDSYSLSRLFISPYNVPQPQTLTQDVAGGVMTVWDPVSYANTVVIGPVTYQNLPVVNPNGLTEGTVLVLKAPGGYIVLGMLGTSSAVTVIDPIRYRRVSQDVSLLDTNLKDIGNLNFLVNTNTEYAIDGAIYYNSTTSQDTKWAWSGPPNMATKWNMFGLSNATLNEIITDVVTGYGDTNTQRIEGLGALATMRPSGWFKTTDTPGLIQLRGALNSSGTAGTVAQGSWLRISELVANPGTTDTYTKIYTATGSRSYDGNGNFIGSPDGDNNMYTWSLSGRNHGNEAFMFTFDATTMRSDLAGATILSASMYLYCFSGSSIPADLTYTWSTTSAIATTFPNNGFSGQDIKNLWPANAWAGFDISSQMVNIVSNGANSVLGGSYNFSDSATGFRGYGFGTSTRPYMQITFSR